MSTDTTLDTKKKSAAVRVYVRVRPFGEREASTPCCEGLPFAHPTVRVNIDNVNGDYGSFAASEIAASGHGGLPKSITVLDPSRGYASRETFPFEACLWSCALPPSLPQFVAAEHDGSVAIPVTGPAWALLQSAKNVYHNAPSAATQADVYECVGVPVLQNALEGYNGCILAYGQTGSGKTHTMMGGHGSVAAMLGTAEGFSSGSSASTSIHERATTTAVSGAANKAGTSSPRKASVAAAAAVTAAPLPADVLVGDGAQQVASSDAPRIQLLPSDAGIIPRLGCDLFDRLRAMHDDNPGLSFRVECAYYEIYNEKVFDLLAPSASANAENLRVRQDATGPFVEGLSWHLLSNEKMIIALIQKGNVERHVAATRMNERSSRSHAILTICVTQSLIRQDGGVTKMTSKLNLVDLAGSERTSESGVQGNQFREATKINLSLTTLGRVIDALADKSTQDLGGSNTFGRRNSFVARSDSTGTTPRGADGRLPPTAAGGTPVSSPVSFLPPYRESLLTWLLMDSLGGNSRTSMISTLSPAANHFDDMLNTLRYACRAKEIVNVAHVNEDPQERRIRELQQQVADLKKKNVLLNQQLHPNSASSKDLAQLAKSGHEGDVSNATPFVEALEARIETQRVRIQELTQELNVTKERLRIALAAGGGDQRVNRKGTASPDPRGSASRPSLLRGTGVRTGVGSAAPAGQLGTSTSQAPPVVFRRTSTSQSADSDNDDVAGAFDGTVSPTRDATGTPCSHLPPRAPTAVGGTQSGRLSAVASHEDTFVSCSTVAGGGAPTNDAMTSSSDLERAVGAAHSAKASSSINELLKQLNDARRQTFELQQQVKDRDANVGALKLEVAQLIATRNVGSVPGTPTSGFPQFVSTAKATGATTASGGPSSVPSSGQTSRMSSGPSRSPLPLRRTSVSAKSSPPPQAYPGETVKPPSADAQQQAAAALARERQLETELQRMQDRVNEASKMRADVIVRKDAEIHALKQRHAEEENRMAQKYTRLQADAMVELHRAELTQLRAVEKELRDDHATTMKNVGDVLKSRWVLARRQLDTAAMQVMLRDVPQYETEARAQLSLFFRLRRDTIISNEQQLQRVVLATRTAAAEENAMMRKAVAMSSQLRNIVLSESELRHTFISDEDDARAVLVSQLRSNISRQLRANVVAFSQQEMALRSAVQETETAARSELLVGRMAALPTLLRDALQRQRVDADRCLSDATRKQRDEADARLAQRESTLFLSKKESEERLKSHLSTAWGRHEAELVALETRIRTDFDAFACSQVAQLNVCCRAGYELATSTNQRLSQEHDRDCLAQNQMAEQTSAVRAKQQRDVAALMLTEAASRRDVLLTEATSWHETALRPFDAESLRHSWLADVSSRNAAVRVFATTTFHSIVAGITADESRDRGALHALERDELQSLSTLFAAHQSLLVALQSRLMAQGEWERDEMRRAIDADSAQRRRAAVDATRSFAAAQLALFLREQSCRTLLIDAEAGERFSTLEQPFWLRVVAIRGDEVATRRDAHYASIASRALQHQQAQVVVRESENQKSNDILTGEAAARAQLLQQHLRDVHRLQQTATLTEVVQEEARRHGQLVALMHAERTAAETIGSAEHMERLQLFQSRTAGVLAIEKSAEIARTRLRERSDTVSRLDATESSDRSVVVSDQLACRVELVRTQHRALDEIRSRMAATKHRATIQVAEEQRRQLQEQHELEVLSAREVADRHTALIIQESAMRHDIAGSGTFELMQMEHHCELGVTAVIHAEGQRYHLLRCALLDVEATESDGRRAIAAMQFATAIEMRRRVHIDLSSAMVSATRREVLQQVLTWEATEHARQLASFVVDSLAEKRRAVDTMSDAHDAVLRQTSVLFRDVTNGHSKAMQQVSADTAMALRHVVGLSQLGEACATAMHAAFADAATVLEKRWAQQTAESLAGAMAATNVQFFEQASEWVIAQDVLRQESNEWRQLLRRGADSRADIFLKLMDALCDDEGVQRAAFLQEEQAVYKTVTALRDMSLATVQSIDDERNELRGRLLVLTATLDDTEYSVDDERIRATKLRQSKVALEEECDALRVELAAVRREAAEAITARNDARLTVEELELELAEAQACALEAELSGPSKSHRTGPTAAHRGSSGVSSQRAANDDAGQRRATTQAPLGGTWVQGLLRGFGYARGTNATDGNNGTLKADPSSPGDVANAAAKRRADTAPIRTSFADRRPSALPTQKHSRAKSESGRAWHRSASVNSADDASSVQSGDSLQEIERALAEAETSVAANTDGGVHRRTASHHHTA